MISLMEPADLTKEASLGEILSGAGNFINNMPSNPGWQNALAGGGGGALLMMLLNLLTGNRMSRGMLPAMLAGGALGGGLPYLYNRMNAGGMFNGASPPAAMPDAQNYTMGPPAPSQEELAKRRYESMSPLQAQQKERLERYKPGTLGRPVTEFGNKLETLGANIGSPFRRLHSAGSQIMDKGLMAPTATDELFRDPLTDARKYSDTNL